MRFLAALLLLAAAAPCETRHVIVIGIDGFAGDAAGTDRTPHLRALIQRGAWTLKARAVMPTVSSPNWASMIMGAGPEQHGVTSNEWQPGKFTIEPVCRDASGRFPTLFGEMRRQRPSSTIAIFHDWQDFGRLVEPGAPTVLKHVKGSPQAAAEAIEYWMRKRPDLLFLHLDDVDHAGHDLGWRTPDYWKAVEMADGLIGQFVKAVDAAGLTARTLILVTADHGGLGKKHGGESMTELLIPWIAAGSGVTPGEIPAPVNTYDTAVTLAAALGLQPHPCWIGRAVQQAVNPASARDSRTR